MTTELPGQEEQRAAAEQIAVLAGCRRYGFVKNTPLNRTCAFRTFRRFIYEQYTICARRLPSY